MRFFDFLPEYIRNWASAEAIANGVSQEVSALVALWGISEALQGRLIAGDDVAQVKAVIVGPIKPHRRLAARAGEPIVQLARAIQDWRPGTDLVLTSPEYDLEMVFPHDVLVGCVPAPCSGRVRRVIVGSREAVDVMLARRGMPAIVCESNGDGAGVDFRGDADGAALEWFRRTAVLSLSARINPASSRVEFTAQARRLLKRMQHDLAGDAGGQIHAAEMVRVIRQLSGVLCAADLEHEIGMKHVQVAAMVVLHFERYRGASRSTFSNGGELAATA